MLAIIPARRGSKRLVNKNIKLLLGKPLISYTIEQAKVTKSITRIVVSTEDDDIARIARQSGISVISRPSSLAQDDTPMFPVIQFTLNYLGKYEGYKPIWIVLLQPTSPLRTVGDIDSAIEIIKGGQFDSLASVFNGKENGAIYIFNRFHILEQNTIYGTRVYQYEMPEQRSVDIDTQEDWDLAEKLMKERDDNSRKNDVASPKRRGRPRRS